MDIALHCHWSYVTSVLLLHYILIQRYRIQYVFILFCHWLYMASLNVFVSFGIICVFILFCHWLYMTSLNVFVLFGIICVFILFCHWLYMTSLNVFVSFGIICVQIQRVDDDIANYLPNLEALVMNNNNIEVFYSYCFLPHHIDVLILRPIMHVQELGDLEGLLLLKRLKHLSLLENMVTKNPHYRQYLIHRMPGLKMLDFQRITRTVRYCYTCSYIMR